jgi:hypothetical protein
VRIACLAALIAVGTAHADTPQLSPDDLDRKNERGYVTGLPLFAFSTDIGLGFGARAYYFWNGTRDDKRFSRTPYLHRIFLQGFVSTRGIQYHWLDYDAPRIADSPYRIRAQLIFGRNISQNYFGHGNRALRPLQFPGSGTFDRYANYQLAQQQVAGGTTFTKYDHFDLQKPLLIASIERLFLGNRVRLLGGFGFAYTTIRDYSGKQVDALDANGDTIKATQATTRLREDCDAGLLVGCEGGREGWLRFGLSYDTRDFEPDPNRGVYADLAIDAYTVALGSEYEYLRMLGAVRGYWSPAPERADLVLAGRVLLQVQTAGTAFFSMDALPFTEDFTLGVGGHRTLRGYRQDRFVGRTMAAATAELRWTFTRFILAKQKFALIAVPFFDLGRSFDNARALTLSDWRRGYGGALRISWNLATVITIDYGRSVEDTGLYINFKHMF